MEKYSNFLLESFILKLLFCIILIFSPSYATNTILNSGDRGIKFSPLKSKNTRSPIDATLPVILHNPLNITAIIPSEQTFSVNAHSSDGGHLTYQWYSISDTKNATGILMDNATFANYTVLATEVGKTGYYCVITNTILDNGNGGIKSVSVTSNTAWFEKVTQKSIKPIIKIQPTKLNIVTKNQNLTLECRAKIPKYSIPVTYQWYQSSDEKLTSVEPVANARKSIFTLPTFSRKEIKYYYCVATAKLSIKEGNENLNSIATVSDIASVVYTGLPILKINTPDALAITSKHNWMNNATVSIEDAENEDWNVKEIKTSIRGRGNYTWTQKKKPYALKFDKKHKLFGMPEHKRWVLIANYLDNSFLRNEIAFYLSEQFGLEWTVHGHFVNLILNGEYRGLYWIGESIKVDEHRINLNNGSETMTAAEDKDYLIEMDVYYDEPVKFTSSIRKLPYMIKNDDYMIDNNHQLTIGGQARLQRLQEKITKLEKLIYPNVKNDNNPLNSDSPPDEAYLNIIDIDSWAKYWLVNEIMDNGELNHPKSCYFIFESKTNIMKAGPVWDFDWASIQENSSIYLKNSLYYDALFKSSSFRKKLKRIWDEKSGSIDISLKIEELRNKISVAADYDAKLWQVNHNPTNMELANFNEHVNFLKATILNRMKIVSNEISILTTPMLKRKKKKFNKKKNKKF